MKTCWTERFLLILACVIAIGSWGTAGRCASDFRTPNEAGLYVYNYKQMMGLSLEDRAAYIRFLRDFLIQEQRLYPATAQLNDGTSDSIAAIFWSVAEADTYAPTGRLCYFGGNLAHLVTRTDSQNHTSLMCSASTFEDDGIGAKSDESYCKGKFVHGIPGVACNRMIFGADTSGGSEEPYCVSRGINATRDCNDDFKDKDALAAAKRFQSMTAADQTNWNIYATKLQDFCTKTPQPECSTLITRLNVIRKPLPQTAGGAGTPKEICNGLYIPSLPRCSDGSCNEHTWLMGIPDPKNPKLYTNLQFLKAATATEKKTSGCQDDDQQCYTQVHPVAGTVTQNQTTGVISIELAKKNDTDPVVTNTIDTGSGLGKCNMTTAAAAAGPKQTDQCKIGTPYCTSDNWPDCGNTNPEHYLIQDKRNGHDKTAHMNANGTSDFAVTAEDKTPRGSDAFGKYLDSLSNPSSTDTHGADDMKAIQDWAKEAGADSKKNATGALSTDFGAAADPGDVGKALNSPNVDYVQGVMSDLAVQKKKCLTTQSWIKINEAQATTWEGAKSTQFYACGTVDSKGKIKSLGGAYLKVHFDKDGKPLMTETGQLDKNGREISANLFRPNDYTPFISIGLKMKTNKKTQKQTPVENEGLMPWNKTREFEATVNHTCPSATDRYMAVLTETNPSNNQTTYRTCMSADAATGFQARDDYKFTQGTGGITTPDPYYAGRTLKLEKDDSGKCVVGRKLTGAADSTYQAAPTYPFTTYGDYIKAPSSTTPEPGKRTQ